MLSSKQNLEWVRTRIKFQGMPVVEAQGRIGGLSLFWKDQDQVKLLNLSRPRIDVKISMSGMQTMCLTGFYEEPNRI